MVKMSSRVLILFLLSIFIVACLPGDKRASNRQTRITQASVEEITAASMSQTLENELARVQVLVQEIFDAGGVTSDEAYNALITGGGFALTQSETVGVGLCSGNAGMYAYLKKDKINGLGYLSEGATTEKIREALVERYGADSVGYYRSGAAVDVPASCEADVSGNPEIFENSPVVVLEAKIIADSQTTHVYKNYEYETQSCPPGKVGAIINRREIESVTAKKLDNEPGQKEILTQGDWVEISNTCTDPKQEEDVVIEWSLRDGSNVDWLDKLKNLAVDPRKQVFCDKLTGQCEQVSAEEATKRIIECSGVKDDNSTISNPIVANDSEELKDVTECSTIRLVSDVNGIKRYSLDNCAEPLMNSCAAETVALSVFQLVDDGGDCMKSCGKGWFGDINSNYQYRECTVSDVDENGNVIEGETTKSIYNFYNTIVDCEKKDYRETNVTCNMADSIASAGEMEVKLKGHIKVQLDDNGGLPTVLKQAQTAEEFDALARSNGYAKDTGEMTSCNAGDNTCKTMSDVDILAIVVDRSASMRQPISFSRKPKIASCSGKVENIFKENNAQELCENLDFKLAVDKLIKELNTAISNMQSLTYYCGDSFDGTYDYDYGYYTPMSMTVEPSKMAKGLQSAVFYTGDNYNPNWAYQPVIEEYNDGEANCPSSYSAREIKYSIDRVNADLKDVYLAYDKYTPNVSNSYIESLTGLASRDGIGSYDGAPYNQNPALWVDYFQRMKNKAELIVSKEVDFLKQGVVSSVDKNVINLLKTSCTSTVTDGIMGVCYPPSALGGGPEQSCQATCLGSCSFTVEEQPVGTRNDLVNMILKNTAVRYAPAKKDTGAAIPVLITEFWGTGITHMVIGFNANGEMEQTILPASLGRGPLGAIALGNPYTQEYFSTTTNGRLNTFLQPNGDVREALPFKVKGPGCLEDLWWDYFLTGLKDGDGNLYYKNETELKEKGLWRRCPTNREEFMALMDSDPPVADGSSTNLYRAVERTMAWVTNLTRNGSLLGGADASGVQKNSIPGRLVIFTDGMDNVGREKLIRRMEMSGSQESSTYPLEQVSKISGTAPAIDYPNDSIEGYVLKYFPQFSVDFMALDGTIKDEAKASVVDYNGQFRITTKVDTTTGKDNPVAWRYALLENDDDEAAFMSLIDTESATGMVPEVMCEKLYDAKVAGGLVVDPDVSNVEDFKYNNEYDDGHQGADLFCLDGNQYSRPYGGSSVGVGGYIPYPAGVGTSGSSGGSGGGSTTPPPVIEEPTTKPYI